MQIQFNKLSDSIEKAQRGLQSFIHKSGDLSLVHIFYRIMVLDAGELKEFASPKQLLNDKESIFYSLALQANLVS